MTTQQHVLENLDRVKHDGSRIERRYVLDGENVAQQVRSLLRQGHVILDQCDSLKKSVPPITEAKINKTAIEEIRAVFDQPPEARVKLRKLKQPRPAPIAKASS